MDSAQFAIRILVAAWTRRHDIKAIAFFGVTMLRAAGVGAPVPRDEVRSSAKHETPSVLLKTSVYALRLFRSHIDHGAHSDTSGEFESSSRDGWEF